MRHETSPLFPTLEAAISFERIGRYLRWADGNRDRAIELYGINTAVSEALYTPMQMLEVALRNRCHTVLTERFGADWFDQCGVITSFHQRQQIKDAKLSLLSDMKKGEPATVSVMRRLTPGRIVAGLTFGFWTNLFGNEYEALWRKCLHKVPAGLSTSGKRKILSRELTPIRLLRNRVAHHEPILYLDLSKRYGKIIEVTEWLLPEAAEWTRHHSRFSEMYDQYQGVISAIRSIHQKQGD